ncbi:MAG TPA: sigma factor-like helix-turn-helix DNA-binding protein [Polyangia bacterium]|nr:sigma factor-like helix-turn-helix DNA-binding protein [Polyangia bacterium]
MSEIAGQLRAQPTPAIPRADRLADMGRAAAAGQEGALEKLLRALAPDMLRILRAVLGPRQGGIDELLRQSVLVFVSAIAQLPDDGAVSTAALVIAFRQALAVRGRWPGSGLEAGAAAVPEPFPELEHRRAVIADLLLTLPPPQAEALGLRAVVGLTVDEIARATGVGAITVRGRLRVAKESLDAALARDPALRALVHLEPAA